MLPLPPLGTGHDNSKVIQIQVVWKSRASGTGTLPELLRDNLSSIPQRVDWC